MTVTSEHTSAEQLVTELVDRLLEDHPPATTPVEKIWAAQFDLGLAWVHFPAGHGGLGLDRGLQRMVDEQLSAAGVPGNVGRNMMGVGMAAPTLVEWGTEEQRARLLRPAFACEEIWCQLFSEPGAGSDVASLAMRAERDGDEWIVNGQKVWTTQAHEADWGLLLARSDPSVPKHEGLTYFVVDMHAPGVEVRPLRQLNGDAEYNEVYFTNVRIPDSRRVGPVGAGWRVAMTTLANERVTLGGLARRRRGSGIIKLALDTWAATDAPNRESLVYRDQLARLWIDAEVGRLTSIRAEQLRQGGTPGPEGSIGKLAVALLQQRVTEFCVELLGAEGMLISGYETGSAMTERASPQHQFLSMRATTIGGGTSEIVRSLIGERVLGLPGEPRPDKGVPWRDVPRS